MKRILLFVGVALLVAVSIVYATLVAATYSPESCTYDLDMAELRTLAASIPGDKATEIRVEHVSTIDFPKAIACPGEPWEAVPFGGYAYQLVFADKKIVVDTAMNAAQAKELGADVHDEAAWQRVATGLTQATAVYVTHEHVDHMGGAFADDKWAGNLRLTARQLDSDTANQPTISPTARAAAKVVAYDRYQAVAPGVVLIEARGHTPGSQMVFVSRADGAEVLLTGDTAWLMNNIEREQGPAKFVGLMMGSDRNQNACQLAALNRVHKNEPNVAIMPGHDKTRMQALTEKGVFVVGFH